jgi:nitrous oxidase accessory protein
LKGVFIPLILIALLISTLAPAYNVGLAKSASSTVVVPDQYPTIQAAINAGGSGDIVYVKNGTYIENVVINKTLSLVGENKGNTTIDGGESAAYSVISITADGVNVTGFTIRGGFDIGVSLNNVSHCNVYGNNIKNVPSIGVLLDSASNNTIAWNNIANIMDGIYIYNSYHNSMIGNNIAGANNGFGILLGGIKAGGAHISFSDYNSVIGNNITANIIGILIGSRGSTQLGLYYGFSNCNSVIGNKIGNNYYGIEAYTNSTENTLYHNNFVNNTGYQVGFSEGSPNMWDDGYPSGGNYWSDYAGVDANGDGVGDTPYVINENNIDHYPLIWPWTPTQPVVTATVKVCPQALNLRSKGRWIIASIELPEGYSAKDIDVSTVMLNNTVPAEMHPDKIKDCKGNDIQVLMVKFDREAAIQYILSTVTAKSRFTTVTLTVTGKLKDGTPFIGSDEIRLVMQTDRLERYFPI